MVKTRTLNNINSLQYHQLYEVNHLLLSHLIHPDGSKTQL
jgi:hypothetical protein